jgi:oligopeptide transport system permease protein
LGPAFAVTISGSVVVESIFHMPGLGQHFIESVETGDAPVIQAIVLLYGTLIIAAKLLADLARLWLNPEMRRQQKQAVKRRQQGTPHMALSPAGFLVLATITVACLVGPWITRLPPPDLQDLNARNLPSSAAHWFGTDHLGRDLLARVLHGGRISLAVGLAAACSSLAIGMAWGTVAGSAGKRTGALLTGIADVLRTLPFLCLVILLCTVLVPPAASLTEWLAAATGWPRGTFAPVTALLPMSLAIGALSWPNLARTVRNQVQATASSEFPEAAKTRGLGRFRILVRHILPSAMVPAIAATTLTMADAMLCEAALSFLGLGVEPPTASWGSLIASGADRLLANPAPLLVPATFLATTLLALHWTGNGLRDTPDPESSKG